MRREFDVREPVEIDIRLASGDIEIDPTLSGRVEVELVGHDDESRALIEHARIEMHEGAGSTVVVDLPQKRGGFSLGQIFSRQGISCRVRCPEGSSIQARTKSADVTTHGRIGGLNVQTASGDVSAERVDGNLTVKSASGDVGARAVAGTSSVQTASGDVQLDVAHGEVVVASASGDVVIGEAYASVSANTVSGDQVHRAVMRDRVAAHSVSGDVEIGVRRGSRVWLDCSTTSGDTNSELEVQSDAPEGDGPLVEIRAKTVSGDIRITRAPAPAENEGVHA